MIKSTSPEMEPNFDESEAERFIGKHLLVGVTRCTRDDEVIGHEQFHGEIIRASRKDGIILRLLGSKEERWLPPDLSRLEAATPGEYRLKGSDEVVIDPDFFSTWTVYPSEREQE